MHIIKKIDTTGDPEHKGINPAMLEPAFLSLNTLASLSKTESAENIINYMAHQVVRNPTDLQNHINRINTYYQRGNCEGLYGGLLDLFLVLQEKGRPLRKRLLQKFYSSLKPEHRAVLSALLAGKTKAHKPAPYVKESRLGDGRTGVGQLLVKRHPARNIQDRDPVEDARDLLNSDQIDRAQTLLEKALLINPQRQDIAQELMAIYRHSHKLQAVENILDCTKNLPLARRAEWQDLAMLLKSETH